MDAGSRVRSIVLALAAAIAATNAAGARSAATDRQLVVGPNVLVSGANRDVPHMEVIACANRTQPSTLLVASMASRRGRTVTVLYQSADAGTTWTPVLETVGAGLMGDPTCAIDPDGRAYYGLLEDRHAMPEILGTHRRQALIYSSPDGGRTWPGEPARQYGNIDRPFLTADQWPGRDTRYVYYGALYGSDSLAGPDPATFAPDDRNVEMGVAIFVSADEGRTFGLAASPRQGRDDWVYGVGNSVVAASGHVITVFRVLKDRFSRPYVERSNDTSMLSVLRTGPGGEPTEPAISIGMAQGSGFSTLAVDATDRGPFRNRLYAVALRAGALVLFWSGDEGRTWHGPTIVRQPAAPAAPPLKAAIFSPAVEVNRDGVVGVAWAEGAYFNPSVYIRSWTYRMTASWDGGETFANSVDVSSDRHDPARPAHVPIRAFTSRDADRQAGTVATDVFPDSGGHTFGLTSDADGVFHPAWTDNRTGVSQVWTASVRARGDVVSPAGNQAAAAAFAAADAIADITNETAVEIGEVTLGASNRQISMTVRVRNGSQRTLLPPLRLEIADVRSKLGEVTPNVRSLDLSGAMPRAGLRPAEATSEQLVEFALPGDGELHIDRGAGEILTMVFKVTGRRR